MVYTIYPSHHTPCGPGIHPVLQHGKKTKVTDSRILFSPSPKSLRYLAFQVPKGGHTPCFGNRSKYIIQNNIPCPPPFQSSLSTPQPSTFAIPVRLFHLPYSIMERLISKWNKSRNFHHLRTPFSQTTYASIAKFTLLACLTSAHFPSNALPSFLSNPCRI